MTDTPNDRESPVGRSIDELDTPVALLDLDVFDSNAATIHRKLADGGLQWRPHSKAHKSPVLARRQLELGAIGVTCAKLGEAEVMAAGGIADILVANLLGSPAKWRRAADLQSTATVTVCVDDQQHVRWASAAAVQAGTVIPLLVEVDVGMHRVGVRSSDDAVALAEQIAATPGVELAGVMGYEGHLPTIWPAAEKVAQCEQALSVLTDAATAIRAAGHQVRLVSSGGTATFESAFGVDGLNESQAGGGCLMDRFYAETCHIDLPFALTLTATTVSVQQSAVAIIDAGFKALGTPANMQPALVLDREGVAVKALSAEHGILATEGSPLRVGDRVRLVPAYSDAMVYLHENLVGHRGGVVTEMIPVAGRGKLA
ncbi:alanine racemase [Nakamurella lactea]|uniref:alanine racemase n=1 Tax=Nakamurella lactea TaxID=459515 RepID=UPI00041529D1|nr:alanine racemase [Nakamurella lactea]